MFPNMKQRVGVVAMVVIGGLLYRHGVDAMRVAGGAEGASLLAADSPISAFGQLLSVTLAVVIMGSIVSALGNPLAGVFAAATALVVPAIVGGPIDEWLRSAAGASDYWTLAIEAGVWAVIITAVAKVIVTTAERLQARLPEIWFDEVADEGDHNDESGLGWDVVTMVAKSVKMRPAVMQSTLAAASATIIGLLPTAILMQTSAVNQAGWSIFVSFIIAGVLAHQLFPSRNPIGILISPLLTAMIWYIYAAVTQDGSTSMLSSYFTDHFVNGATALPIFYASAGVAGAAMGIGWSQALIKAHLAEQKLAERREGESDSPEPQGA